MAQCFAKIVLIATKQSKNSGCFEKMTDAAKAIEGLEDGMAGSSDELLNKRIRAAVAALREMDDQIQSQMKTAQNLKAKIAEQAAEIRELREKLARTEQVAENDDDVIARQAAEIERLTQENRDLWKATGLDPTPAPPQAPDAAEKE